MSRTVKPQRTVVLSSYYDATATTSEQDWPTYPSFSEDLQYTSPQRWIALARLRREVRNNPFLAGLVAKYPEAIGTSQLRSRTSDRDYNHRKDLFWFRWSKRVTRKKQPLKKVEAIVLSELVLTGEIFILKLRSGRIQLIPSEFCGSPFAGRLPGETNGIIERDGVITGYRFGRMNETGSLVFDQDPVPAKFITHVYMQDRVMMGRGLPWIQPSIVHARNLYEICRAKTKQIKDANSISGALETDQPNRLAGLRGLRPGESDETRELKKEVGTAAADNPGPIKVELAPGTFITLEPGEKLHQLTTQYNATDYKDLIMLMLHGVAAPVQLPVELWFSGLGEVNFSGFKGLGVQWKSRREYIIDQVVEPYLDDLHAWRIGKAEDEGDLPPNPDGDRDLYELRFKRTAILDDEKNAKTNKTRLESGEASLVDVWEENGAFAEEVLESRRQLWIKLQIAAGELDEADDHSAIQVPKEFLLRGKLPGEKGAGPANDGDDSGETKPPPPAE